jgi:hypothetical protein
MRRWFSLFPLIALPLAFLPEEGRAQPYPFGPDTLGGGDVNLYSLFVERAETLVAKDGLVALLTPSGIAADKGAAEFFRSISGTGRLGALFDFENKGVFFPDVHDNFKFVALVFGGQNRTFTAARLAFYLRRLAELSDPARVINLSPQDFQRFKELLFLTSQNGCGIRCRLHRIVRNQ